MSNPNSRIVQVDDKPEVRLPNGRFGPGNKTGGRKRRADEEEMLALFDRAFPKNKRIAVLEKIVDKAMHGNMDCVRFLWSYIYGTPIQRQEHTGADGEALIITIMERKSGQEDRTVLNSDGVPDV